MFEHDVEHLSGGHVLEPGPAHIGVGNPLVVVALREDRILNGLTQLGGLVLSQGLKVVQSLEKEQVGDLLDDLKRIRDAA